MLASIRNRLAKLEARRPAQGPAQLVDASRLDPVVLALRVVLGIDQMTLTQLAPLEENLRRPA